MAILSKKLRIGYLWLICMHIAAIGASQYVPLRTLQPDSLIPIVHPTKMAALFFDRYESDFGGVTIDLLNFLRHPICPILATRHLIFNIIIFREYDPELINLFKKNTRKSRKYSVEQQEKFNKELQSTQQYELFKHAVSLNNFNPGAWRWLEVNDALYLLLPSATVPMTSVRRKEILTSIEIACGLRIDHLKKVSYAQLKRDFCPRETLTSHGDTIDFLQQNLSSMPSYDFVDSLIKSRVIIPNIDYVKYGKVYKIPQWILYVSGHGGLNTSIASISISKFQELIRFLNHGILTRLLVLSSCYGAGTNTRLLFRRFEQDDVHDTTVAFPILIDGFSDATTCSDVPLFRFATIDNSRAIVPVSLQKLEDLPKILTHTEENISYGMIHAAFAFKNTMLMLQNQEHNFSIRPHALEIGNVMTERRKKALVVSQYFRSRIKGQQECKPTIFLNSPYIPFMLQFPAVETFPTVYLVSNMLLNGIDPCRIHIIKHIRFPAEKDFQKALRFCSTDKRLINIKTVNFASDKARYLNVVCHGDTDTLYTAFRANQRARKIYFCGKDSNSFKRMDQNEKKEYQKLLQQVKAYRKKLLP